ncbi:IS605 OrfB family transposase [Saccharopolyspora lacisalsi]|uniref:IS605 OrfB family transposase n=1 Tax=Halosaccharopolyspora lacisalsi TaxID=1000566 RepID=A0A839DZY5_9PSEU|nr:IS605 OrfB family transposase [Halosaccharopolyspora lacisalsi]
MRRADTIAIEDLNVSGMTSSARGTREQPGRNVKQKSGLNRRVLDAPLGEFRRQLEYKTTRAGKTLAVIDRWYPSSKTCSACGHLLNMLKLSTRTWTCPGCRTRHDRDVNAAKNILAAGRAVVGQQPGEACGVDVSPQGSSLRQSASKQELSGASPKGIPALQGGEAVNRLS